MKHNFLSAAVCVALAGCSGQALACTNLIATKGAMADGSNAVSYTHLTLPTILLV